MFFFGLGGLFYGTSPKPTIPEFRSTNIPTVAVLLINGIAILSEDRFLARSTYLPTKPNRTQSHTMRSSSPRSQIYHTTIDSYPPLPAIYYITKI
jgi:hypothetical protein